MSVSDKQVHVCFEINIFIVKGFSWLELVCCCKDTFLASTVHSFEPEQTFISFFFFSSLCSHWELLQSEKDIFYINYSTSTKNQWKIYRFPGSRFTIVSCKHGNW